MLADRIAPLGFDVRDVSGDLAKIGFYERCDLHVGYRVHAHIHFLSRRNPSILLHEDGRGRGVDEALGLPGIPAWSRTLRGRVVGRLSEALTGGEAKPPGAVVADKEAPDRLRAVLEGELRSRWSRFAGLPAVIDAHYDVMTRFLRSLPGA
jgi:polysaccharide pyruvyl transferase WcaK-like protein